MAKRVVFCADGTWQDSLNDTNVYRLYKALTVSSGDLLAFPQPALKSLRHLTPLLPWLHWGTR